jgi:hypothetical protein
LEAISGSTLTAATDANYICDCDSPHRLPPSWQLVADQGRIRFGAGFRLPVNRKAV